MFPYPQFSSMLSTLQWFKAVGSVAEYVMGQAVYWRWRRFAYRTQRKEMVSLFKNFTEGESSSLPQPCRVLITLKIYYSNAYA